MDQSALREFGALLVSAWVMVDASKRGISGRGAFLWGLGTFLLIVVGLPLWLILRPPVPGEESPPPNAPPGATPRGGGLDRCPACNGRLRPEDPECPTCGIHFLHERSSQRKNDGRSERCLAAAAEHPASPG